MSATDREYDRQLAAEKRSAEVGTRFKISKLERLGLEALRYRQGQPPDAVPTFLPSWNGSCRGEGAGVGLARGWFVVIAGATGAGKTLVALNVVYEALKYGEKVLYISLEMSWEQLITRLRAIATGLDIRCLEWGDGFDESEAEAADASLLGLPGQLFYNKLPIWKLDDVRELMESYRETEGIRFFILDYLQLVSPGGSERIFEATMKVSQQLRFAAQSLDAVCVAVSQFNRQTSANRSDRPIVQGLLGGSSTENDASQVLLLDHTRRKRDEHVHTEKTFLLLAKNRHGPQGEIAVEFDFRTMRVREAKPDEEGEWP